MLIANRSLDPPVKARESVTFEEILSCLAANGRLVDRRFLTAIHDFSARSHKDQVRRSGEPYLIHPLNVAYILAELNFDQTCVAVGLLHDVLEDTLTTRDVLEGEFGGEVTELVDGVTKIGRHAYVRRDEAQAETFRKMILASAKDIRVILVKLADRLHNMQTLADARAAAARGAAADRARRSRSTPPIAHRLGMGRVKGIVRALKTA